LYNTIINIIIDILNILIINKCINKIKSILIYIYFFNRRLEKLRKSKLMLQNICKNVYQDTSTFLSKFNYLFTKFIYPKN
jgi:hypothetical protein